MEPPNVKFVTKVVAAYHCSTSLVAHAAHRVSTYDRWKPRRTKEFPLNPRHQVYHPNVSKEDGNICCSVLNMPPKVHQR
mgnify:CR=1 FL=1